MKRAPALLFGFLISWCITGSLGVLMYLRPWATDSVTWDSQQPDIFTVSFLLLQVPGFVAFAWLFQPSYLEPALFIFASYLLISTWKNSGEKADLIKLRKLGRLSYLTFMGAIAIRILYTIVTLPEEELQTSNPWDIRGPQMQFLWVNFESTLILTLVLVHLKFMYASRKFR